MDDFTHDIHEESLGDFLAQIEEKRELAGQLIDEAESFFVVAVSEDGTVQGVLAMASSLDRTVVMFSGIHQAMLALQETLEKKHQEAMGEEAS